MKSFFKKLAFVMALAMVVSMAAPAAANAAVALVAAHQTSKEVVTELEMEVGQEIDLCFLNAQKGWKELNRGWKVTKGEGVVTVDNNGVVKAVKNGDATIEFFMEGYESAVVTITVGEEETYGGYAQTSPNTVDFFLTGDLSKVTKAEVKLYRVFATADGKEVEVTWPVNTAVGTTEGKLSVTPFVQFADGGEYRLAFKGETYDFTTVLPTIDEITFVDTTFGTYDGNWWYNKDNNQAFVTEEDDEVESVVDFGYRVWYYHEGSLMNVTSLFDSEDLAIEYEMITPDADSEAAESVNFDSDGTVVFADIVPVYVQVVASYETEDGEEVKLPTNGVEVIPTKKAPLAISEVVDWAFDKVSNTAQNKFSWALKTIPAGESDAYQIVLKVKDTRGNIYVTKAAANKNGNGTFPVLGEDDTILDDYGYSFRFYSTDTDDFLLGEFDGIIETYKKVNDAVFYVDLYKYDDEDSEDKKVESIYAAEFNLGAPRAFSTLYPATKTLNVVADAIDDALLAKSVKITALDQYNDPFGIYDDWYLSCNDKDAKYGTDFWYDDSASKEVVVYVNGAKLYEHTGATSLTFTLKHDDYGISTTFKVNIGKPQWVDKSTETSKTNVEPGYFASNKPEGKEQYSWDIIIDQFKKNGVGHNTITFKVDRNDPFTWLGDAEGETYGGNTNYHREAIVSLYKTSNKQIVGFQNVGDYVVLTNKDWLDTTTGVVATGNGDHTVAVGDRLIALVRGGKVTAPYYGLYTLDINPTDGTVTIPLANHYSNETDRISYAYSGNYDLVVYTITEVETNNKGEVVFDYEADTVSFNVRDQRGAVTFGERTKFETDYDFDGTTNDLEDLKKIVIDCFSFKLGGAAWGLNNDWDASWELIDSVTYEVKDDKVIIKTVQFNVPVDGSVDLDDGEDYYRENSTKVTINQSVKMK